MRNIEKRAYTGDSNITLLWVWESLVLKLRPGTLKLIQENSIGKYTLGLQYNSNITTNIKA